MLGYVPVWVACLGTLLVALRFVLVARSVKNRDPAPQIIRSWILGLLALVTAIAIRQSLGYFIGRDPCVAFLFALIGIKYPRDAQRARRNADRLPRVPADRHAVLLQPVAARRRARDTGGRADGRRAAGARAAGRARRRCPADGGRRSPSRSEMFAQGVPLAVTLFLLFPRIAGPLWSVPADHSASSGLSDHMAPGVISELSLSDAVAFRVDFEGAVPPPWLRYWRGPVLSRFDGREWTMGPQRPLGGRSPAPKARRSSTPSRSSRTGSRGCSRSTCRRAFRKSTSDSDVSVAHRRERRADARPAAHRALPGHAAAALPADVEPAQRVSRVGGRRARARDRREPSVAARRHRTRIRAPNRFARELRRTHPDDAGYIDAVLDGFNKQSFFYTLAPPLLGDESGGRLPVRHAPRLLRALRERLRRDAARGRAFRRGWSPATRAARSIRTAIT